MEVKVIIGFILAVLWSFIVNYRKQAANRPVPVPEQPVQPVPVKRRIPKVDASPKPFLPEGRNLEAKKLINKKTPAAAAFSATPDSLLVQTADASVPQPDRYIDEQINEFAENLRLKLGSPNGAREAFIYSEIFNRRV